MAAGHEYGLVLLQASSERYLAIEAGERVTRRYARGAVMVFVARVELSGGRSASEQANGAQR